MMRKKNDRFKFNDSILKDQNVMPLQVEYLTQSKKYIPRCVYVDLIFAFDSEEKMSSVFIVKCPLFFF